MGYMTHAALRVASIALLSGSLVPQGFLVSNLGAQGYGNAWAFADAGGIAVYAAYSPATANDNLWRSDGTLAGSGRMTSWANVGGSSLVGLAFNPITSDGNGVLVPAYLGSGCTIWQVDRIGDRRGHTIGGANDYHFEAVMAAGRTHVEIFNLSTSRQDIWQTDGAAAQPLTTGLPGTQWYILGLAGPHVVWSSLQTSLLFGSSAQPSIAAPNGLTLSPVGSLAARSRLYFGGIQNGRPGLWMTDGLSIQQVFVMPIGSTVSLQIAGCRDDTLMFHGADQQGAALFYYSDAAQGAVPFYRITGAGIQALSYDPSGAQLGDRLCFWGQVAGQGLEPCITDFTAQGTHIIADIATGPNGSGGSGMMTVGHRKVVFHAYDPTVGQGLYWTDGLVVQRVGPSAAFGTLPSTHAVLAGHLVYYAHDQSQVWAFFPGATSKPIGSTCGGLTLRTSDPVTGASVTISGTGTSPGGLGILAMSLGLPPARPQAAFGCLLYVDLATAFVGGVFLPGSPGGTWSTAFNIPQNPGLNGLNVALQATTADGAGGMIMSNGVRWHISSF